MGKKSGVSEADFLSHPKTDLTPGPCLLCLESSKCTLDSLHTKLHLVELAVARLGV